MVSGTPGPVGAVGVVASTLLAGENKKSGPIGLAVILLLCIACYFLFKSMSRHLRKVREEFPADAPAQGGELSPGAVQPAAPRSRDDGAASPDTAQPAKSPPSPPADERA